ncbi:MAG: NADP-dependent isocitrate dehydrogenase [Chlamydiota bacterium]
MSKQGIPIAVAYGDGIGPEIMEATLYILEQAGANLDFRPIEIGEKVYLAGHLTGIEASSWDVIKEAKAFLKAPITTPQGGGFKSLNVTIRTTLGLYANIRPCVSYAPFIKTKHPKMDLVVIRENEEDLYAGIEYRQTPHVCQSIKLISREGSEKIIRYAFAYARQYGRKKVTCFTKDNIMKFSDGLFHQVFEEVAKEYPDIINEHWIVDIGAAKLADTPEAFDVLVLPNLYGDILSDVAAQISGSVGLAGSANIGTSGAMFEAIHGSAPRRASQNMANPSGLIQASILMLNYLGEIELAERIHNAWLKTLEAGIHTYDVFVEGKSKLLVGTKEFARAVVKFLGEKPEVLSSVSYQKQAKIISSGVSHQEIVSRELVGVDIYLYDPTSAEAFLKKINLISSPLKLSMISNRGVQIWPEGHIETSCIEQWRCRFFDNKKITQQEIIALLTYLTAHGYDIIKTENLYQIDGKPGYSSAQR